jgi:hypothetical protein
VGYSEDFKSLIRDIAGTDGIRGFARRVKVSSSYAKVMMDGSVPSEEVLGRIVEAYQLDESLTHRLFTAAKNTRQDVNTETLIQTACIAEGLSTADRIAILTLFRELADRKGGEQAA